MHSCVKSFFKVDENSCVKSFFKDMHSWVEVVT
jgi:hypothetical protein